MIAGRFVDLKKLGDGAFSRVYQAHDAVTKKRVAIKIDVTGQKTGRNNTPLIFYEANILSALQHVTAVPNVLWTGYIQDRQQESVPALALQILGTDLEQLISKRGPLTAYSSAVITTSLLSTVKDVHEAGFLHRDIKPANIMIGEEGDNNVYLCDFGLAKRYLDKSNNHITNVKKNGVTGTIRYCSPYSHCGEESSRRDDVLSLAYVMIFLVTNHLPWQKPPNRTKDEVGKLKMNINTRVLCAGCPPQFAQMYTSARRLEFDASPDYVGLHNILSSVAPKVA